MKLKELSTMIFPLNQLDQTVEDLDIVGVTNDTRKLSKGFAFVCIEGAQVDGHRFVRQAVEQGASLIVARQPVEASVPVLYVPNTAKALAQLSVGLMGNPSTKMDVVGVTGTNGKTTITNLIAQIAQNIGKRIGLMGTMYNQIVERQIPTINTTPDAVTIQALMAEMVAEKVDVCAMEVSSHALDQGRTWGIDFDVAVFTNLTQDHLEYHHTMENYYHAKSLLFSQLGNAYGAQKKYAVINVDDAYGRRLAKDTAAEVLTYGCHGQGVFQATNIQVTDKGTQYDLLFKGESTPVQLQLVGDFNVYNSLAAIAATYALGYDLTDILQAVTEIAGIKGRFQLVPNDTGITAIVDYAHTPDGLVNVLETVQKFARQDVYCVVGCGGDRDPGKRPIMAEVAMRLATYPIFTSDNPRTEDPQTIVDEMTKGLNGDYQVILDREAAIYAAMQQAKPGDVVLVAGKGHEDYQIIGTEKHHFDDVEVIQAATNSLRN